MYEFTTSLMLKSTLNQLGMSQAFTDAANFSKMTSDGTSGLSISDVIHKTFIGVDEKGVEAAAATTILIQASAAYETEVELTIDRPFMFVIYEHSTHTPLFVGHVMDPSAK